MYRFQINASTQKGESIGLVGSIPELGLWDLQRSIPLQTRGDRYPLWWVDLEIDMRQAAAQSGQGRIEYKYVCFGPDGNPKWEALRLNRWLPIEPEYQDCSIVVEGGWFGVAQACPFGYFLNPPAAAPIAPSPNGLKIVVIGSSVALGCNAWLLKGWADHLAQALHQTHGHRLVNASEVGANVSTTIDRFPLVVPPEKPDIVIIALSLGNEGLAYCFPHQRRAVQRRFESGLQQLIKMTRQLGAQPILGGVYPHGEYSPEHYWLLRDTHSRMMHWGVPVLNWLPAVDDGQGRWQVGTSSDPTHPNGEGHRRMFQAIDLNLFQVDADELAKAKQPQPQEIPIYRDDWGFHLFTSPNEKYLRVINTSNHPYRIHPHWQELQSALRHQAGLIPGIYIAKNAAKDALPFFSVRQDGTIETTVEIPAAADLEYHSAFHFFSPNISEILFYDGHLGILKENDHSIRVINESEQEYNIHPMWKEVRSALKVMPSGVYEDLLYPELPFRTMMIGEDGLESRVKAPPRSSILFQYQCPLSAISRIALIPLGDRCAIRMLLYKMEYDGPAFPFDLTRTTNLADVADMIATNFQDMWNPAFLHYSPDAGRIYHTKWTGLSFAHEVDATDDPIRSMTPVYERMRIRYTARSQRFWYTVQHCDKALFIRTGVTNRDCVLDLLEKLKDKCQGKSFRLLLISPQPSEEFADLPNLLHRNLEFNPDRMYEDLGYWMHCTDVMRKILESVGVSSKNLFWCPPKPPKSALPK